MKLLIIGASRGTGLLLTKQSLRAGHEVIAFSRSASQMPMAASRLTKHTGDFHNADDLGKVMPGQDAVIITASLPMLHLMHEPEFFSSGTARVLDSMRAHQVPKIVLLSNLAAGDGIKLLNPLEKLFTLTFIRKATADHTRQEELVKASGLNWSIARPSRLTNGPARGQYQALSGQRVPSSISRADVANFLLEVATTSRWDRQTLNIGG